LASVFVIETLLGMNVAPVFVALEVDAASVFAVEAMPEMGVSSVSSVFVEVILPGMNVESTSAKLEVLLVASMPEVYEVLLFVVETLL
jgi:hypothetical protein